MTLEELGNILDATGYPVAYSHFKTTQSAPFICYKESYTDNFSADNRVYKKASYVDVELYTSKKDMDAESALENVFAENKISWNAVETYIEKENLFQRIYEISLI